MQQQGKMLFDKLYRHLHWFRDAVEYKGRTKWFVVNDNSINPVFSMKFYRSRRAARIWMKILKNMYNEFHNGYAKGSIYIVKLENGEIKKCR